MLRSMRFGIQTVSVLFTRVSPSLLVALPSCWVRLHNFSPVCDSGNFMYFCESSSAPVCGLCPDGTATERASYDCEICTSGYFALAGSRECTPCPAGKYGTGDGGVVEETACT